MDKIAEKRKEVLEQERKKNGRWMKKRDSFLLWGEYPKGWQMIKDSILCVMLMAALINQVKQIDVAQLMAPKVVEYVQEVKIQPARAEEPKAEEKPIEKATEQTIGEFSAYTSEVSQTDADPYTMASGKRVYAGAIANNCLPFGTKIKVNGKVKVVEDRMNSRYGCEHFDIWMENYDEAISFGRKSIAYEIVK